MRPYVITKHNPHTSPPHDLSLPFSPSCVQGFVRAVSEASACFPPYPASFLEDSDDDDSDAESDSEWYTRQFPKFLSLALRFCLLSHDIAYPQPLLDDEEGLFARGITFDLDYSMTLPLLLPAMPGPGEAQG
jgi:hypothetical protein